MVNTARIFLIGMMGSGKSSTGAELAMQIGFDHVDTDDLLIQQNGPIEDIFAEQGEQAFRRMETQLLAELLERSQVVISTGGGMPIFEQNMDKMLTQGTVVYLEASIDVLVSRLHGQTSQRPLLDEDTEPILRRLEASRSATYKRAHFVVNTDNLKPSDAAVSILHELKNASR